MNYEAGFTKEIGKSEPYVMEDVNATSRKKWLIAGLLLALAALGVALYFYTNSATDSAAKPTTKQAPRVSVVVPGRTFVENIVTATGSLAARQDMPVGAVGEGGLVTQVLVQPGSWVGRGQVLAVVDRQVQAQQINQIAAQISAAQAEAALAQAELDRAQALVSRGFISKAEIQRKAATRDGARARVRVVQAQLSESRARIGRLDIRAPDAGLVLTRSVEPGQVVGGGGGVLFRIAKGGQMELRAQMSEADLARMAVGQRATVTPVGSTDEYSGQIWQLSPVIDQQTRQGIVRIAVPYNRALRPGGFASTKIASGAVEAPLLPESAVLSDAKGNYVYVVSPANKTERRAVTVGNVTDQGVSIIAGLTGTEKVILSAGGFLAAGEAVIPELNPAKR